MNPTVEILKTSERFKLIRELDFSSTVPFLLKYIRKPNLPMFFWYIFHFLLLSAIIWLFVLQVSDSGIRWTSVLKYISFGFFLGAVPVIPVHELIHGLACRMIGAKRIRYGVEWDYMMFYAAADLFVMNRRQFAFVALLPFILLSGMFLGFALFAPAIITLMWLSACFFHGTMCVGDFGLLSFYVENRREEVYTYDDVKEKKTFFYTKI